MEVLEILLPYEFVYCNGPTNVRKAGVGVPVPCRAPYLRPDWGRGVTHVTSPLGHNVNVNRVYKNYLIIIHYRECSADLIALPFHEFDLILGMDWLPKHRAIIDYDKKTVVLRCSDQSEVIVHGVRSSLTSNVISAMQAR